MAPGPQAKVRRPSHVRSRCDPGQVYLSRVGRWSDGEAHMDGGSQARVVRAPRGSKRSCLGWQQEAAMRMLMNNLDPSGGASPGSGGLRRAGKAARDWSAMQPLWHTQRLRDDETLLVQSGKPVGVFDTHPGAPRVLIANAISCRIGPRGRVSALGRSRLDHVWADDGARGSTSAHRASCRAPIRRLRRG